MVPLQTISWPSDARKPGRTLTQYQADEIARYMGVGWPQIRAPYKLTIRGNEPAGNHYHRNKREIIEVLFGTVKVILEDPNTGERQEVILSEDGIMDRPQAVVIPLGIAHVVIPMTVPCVLWVWATEPARQPDDDYEHVIVPKHDTPQETPHH